MTARVGLALGAGGARGWCHIGVLTRLGELGIRPDVAAGCSMGALVGAAYAAGRLDRHRAADAIAEGRRMVDAEARRLTALVG